LNLLPLIAYAGNREATDGRDRVHSLLGLAQDSDIVGSPDYDATIPEVYIKLVHSFVEHYRRLDIICLGHNFTCLDEDDVVKDRDLPSWASPKVLGMRSSNQDALGITTLKT